MASLQSSSQAATSPSQLDRRKSEGAERSGEREGQLFHGVRASANERRSCAARNPPITPAK
eukprot:3525108-Heterocapsa_arctica.AAC.1